MNSNQKVFETVTGFRASWLPMGAAMDYELSEIKEIVEATVEHYDIVCDECVDVERVVKAILDFHACDTGRGCDLDAIFNSL
jgi:hypothetical protein